jgi:hypothetical protein
MSSPAVLKSVQRFRKHHWSLLRACVKVVINECSAPRRFHLVHGTVSLNVARGSSCANGVVTYEVAETKVTQVIAFSRKHQHPCNA